MIFDIVSIEALDLEQAHLDGRELPDVSLGGLDSRDQSRSKLRFLDKVFETAS
jgi:hypothetical protein